MLSPKSNWYKEFSEKGNYHGIIDRMVFHVGLKVSDIHEHTGLSYQTIRKHMRRLVDEGLVARTSEFFEFEHYRITDKMRELYGCAA